MHHVDGVLPAWPAPYQEFEPFYAEAKTLFAVHGTRGEDPTEPWSSSGYGHPAFSHEPRIQPLSDDWAKEGLRPFHLPLGIKLDERGGKPTPTSICIRCDAFDGSPCLLNGKAGAQVMTVDMTLAMHNNVTVLVNAYVSRLETDPAGKTVTGVRVDRAVRRRGRRAMKITSQADKASAKPTRRIGAARGSPFVAARHDLRCRTVLTCERLARSAVMATALSRTLEPDSPAARLWTPRRVLITRSARGFAHGWAIAERAAGRGAEVVELASDRVVLPKHADQRAAYREAKSTLAVVVAPHGKRRLQPIPPSADWRFDLAEGCHAHCQYCYLAGSLAGPPITRVYANVEEILAALPEHLGRGGVTSASAERAHEGTTFEASCYADPLGIEHLTGSLAEAVRFFGRWDAPVQLRFTSKFAGVAPLIGLAHGRRVRVRMSVNAPALIRYDGGTSPLAARLDALAQLARDGYPVGLTLAPIQPLGDWQAGYAALFEQAARVLSGLRALDLTVELITHRFTPSSKSVLQGWYPGSDLDLDEAGRSRKLTKFGSTKFVYPAQTMRAMRVALTGMIAEQLPNARLLYWT